MKYSKGYLMLDMKTECLVCETELAHNSEALICSYECTYCMKCGKELAFTCKNCNGELLTRPKRG
jgi:hypothetical protein